ncbi:MAG TPA: hypothetical protein VJC02_01025 [Candidatus Paceibacterota bacterium]
MTNERNLKLYITIFLLLFISSAQFVLAQEDDDRKNRDKNKDKILPDVSIDLRDNIQNRNSEDNRRNENERQSTSTIEYTATSVATSTIEYTATSVATSTSIYANINENTNSNTPSPQPEASPPASSRENVGGVSAALKTADENPKIIDTRKFDMWVKDFLSPNSYASGGFSEGTTRILSAFAILSGIAGVAILLGPKVYV